MGISPEGTNNNPVKYDLFLEMMWEEEDIDLNEWLTHYIERRYGELSEGAQKAWEVLLETAYQNSSNYADPPNPSSTPDRLLISPRQRQMATQAVHITQNALKKQWNT